MAENETAPDGGNGQAKSKWEELGFDSEDAMAEAATATADLRRKTDEAEATLTKERAAKTKTDSDFMRQSNEIGELRKKLAATDQNLNPGAEASTENKGEEKPEDALATLSEEEATNLDAVLNDPANLELKKKVALGGASAMAEFVKAYRAEAPVDLTVSLFANLKNTKAETVQKSSIAKEVKALFTQHNAEERNNLAAVVPTGTPPDRMQKANKQMVVGGVGVDFFKKT